MNIIKNKNINLISKLKLNTQKKHNYKNSSFFSFIFFHLLLLFFIIFSTFSSFFLFSTIFSLKKANASVYTNYIYAQIKSDDTYLYKTPSNATVQNAYFALPNTYFVMLLSNYDDYFYKVQYRDMVGFVLKQKVFPIKEKPMTPYLKNITFRVYSSDGTKVYSSPFNTKDAVVQATVEVFETIDYYGFILGDELIENRGLSWYYGKTQKQSSSQEETSTATSNSNTNQTPNGTLNSNTTHISNDATISNSTQNSNNNLTSIATSTTTEVAGYFYSGLCDSLSAIPQNTEKVTPNNQVFLDEDNSFLFGLIDLSPALKILLVVLISLPSVGLVYLLFKPFKLRQEVLNRENFGKSKNFGKLNKNKNTNNSSEKQTPKRNLNSNKQANDNLVTSKPLSSKIKTSKSKTSKSKNVLQSYKQKRNLKMRNKNATINKIQKIINDDIL